MYEILEYRFLGSKFLILILIIEIILLHFIADGELIQRFQAF